MGSAGLGLGGLALDGAFSNRNSRVLVGSLLKSPRNRLYDPPMQT